MALFERAVGKAGQNLIHDVAALQGACKILATQKNLQFWDGPVDGNWQRHSADLQTAITQLEQHFGAASPTGRIDPQSPTANRLAQLLPMQYQGLRGVKGTACLVVEDRFASRQQAGLSTQHKENMPHRCCHDLDCLQKDCSQKLGFDLAIDDIKTDPNGCCTISFMPHGVRCLDARLQPLSASQPMPKPVQDAFERLTRPLTSLRPRSGFGRSLQVETTVPIKNLTANKNQTSDASNPTLHQEFELMLQGAGAGIADSLLQDAKVRQAYKWSTYNMSQHYLRAIQNNRLDPIKAVASAHQFRNSAMSIARQTGSMHATALASMLKQDGLSLEQLVKKNAQTNDLNSLSHNKKAEVFS